MEELEFTFHLTLLPKEAKLDAPYIHTRRKRDALPWPCFLSVFLCRLEDRAKEKDGGEEERDKVANNFGIAVEDHIGTCSVG